MERVWGVKYRDSILYIGGGVYQKGKVEGWERKRGKKKGALRLKGGSVKVGNKER
jgi:hypothetical protein